MISDYWTPVWQHVAISFYTYSVCCILMCWYTTYEWHHWPFSTGMNIGTGFKAGPCDLECFLPSNRGLTKPSKEIDIIYGYRMFWNLELMIEFHIFQELAGQFFITSFSSFLIPTWGWPTWAMILVRPCQPSWFQHLKPTSSISVRSVSRKDPECGLRSICFLDAGACANARNPRILPPWHVPRMLVKQCHKPRCSWFNPSTWWWLGFF